MANRHHHPEAPMSDSNNDDTTSAGDKPRTEADVHMARLDDFESPTIAVASVVSDAIGADQQTVPALYEVVDPDALDKLFRHRRHAQSSELRVSFRYMDCLVTIRSAGEITVRPT